MSAKMQARRLAWSTPHPAREAAATAKADKPAAVKTKDDGDKAQALLEGKPPAAPASAASEPEEEEVTVGDEPVTSAEVAASDATPAASGAAPASPTASEPVSSGASAPSPPNEGASEGT